jgi:esterase/lipase
LPGHGTQPGDLLDVTWQEWAKAVAYGTDKLDAEVDEIYLTGLSAGATLSIYQSLRDERVRGLFLFSPALRVSPRAARANWHKLYSWLVPSAKWISIMPDADIYKYESLPKNAAAQMHALTQEISRQLLRHEVDIPVFSAASRDDATVDVTATLEFMARAPHPSNRLVLYTTDTNIIPPNIPAKKLELVSSLVPEQKILSSAHTAIVLSPDDAHYGAAGDYSNCLHYFPDDIEKYAACSRNSPEVMQGEVTEINLRAGVVRRLMYNPHFAALKISMQKFIENLP